MSLLKTLLLSVLVGLASCKPAPENLSQQLLTLEKSRVLAAADTYLSAPILTITDTTCERSAGGIHDFYSEGDYWWPDSLHPGGPYIRRDGLSNPANFSQHRLFMRRLSLMVPALVAAYSITHEQKYADRALAHLQAWFVNPDTRMNPNLLYSQAIYGIATGRGIGIIDAIHLVEVVQACRVLQSEGLLSGDELHQTQQWFADFTTWITTHPYGMEEKNNGNNHSTCWAMQVAMYARFTGNDSLIRDCKSFYTHTLLPDQLAPDGSFPKELARTKPYGYALFNLDAMFTLAHILAEDDPHLWQFGADDSLLLKLAVDYMYPFVADKTQWPYPPDVLYFDEWPMRQAALLFAYEAYGEEKYFTLWKTLPPDSETDEVLRNFFVRQPLLWVGTP